MNNSFKLQITISMIIMIPFTSHAMQTSIKKYSGQDVSQQTCSSMQLLQENIETIKNYEIYNQKRTLDGQEIENKIFKKKLSEINSSLSSTIRNSGSIAHGFLNSQSSQEMLTSSIKNSNEYKDEITQALADYDNKNPFLPNNLPSLIKQHIKNHASDEKLLFSLIKKAGQNKASCYPLLLQQYIENHGIPQECHKEFLYVNKKLMRDFATTHAENKEANLTQTLEEIINKDNSNPNKETSSTINYEAIADLIKKHNETIINQSESNNEQQVHFDLMKTYYQTPQYTNHHTPLDRMVDKIKENNRDITIKNTEIDINFGKIKTGIPLFVGTGLLSAGFYNFLLPEKFRIKNASLITATTTTALSGLWYASGFNGLYNFLSGAFAGLFVTVSSPVISAFSLYDTVKKWREINSLKNELNEITPKNEELLKQASITNKYIVAEKI